MSITLIETVNIFTSEWISPGIYRDETLIIKCQPDDSFSQIAGYIHQLVDIEGLGYSSVKQWLVLFDHPVALLVLPTEQPYKLAFYKKRWLNSFLLEIYCADTPIINWEQNSFIEQIANQIQTTSTNISDSLNQISTLTQKIDNLMALYSNLPSSGNQGTGSVNQYSISLQAEESRLFNNNIGRQGLIIQNLSSEDTLYLGFTNSVNDEDYFMAIPPNSSYSFDTVFTGEVWAYCSSQQLNIKVIEFGSDSFNQALLPAEN